MSNRMRLFMQRFFLCIFFLFLPINLVSADELLSPASDNSLTQYNAISIPEKNSEKLRDILPLYEEALQNPWPILPQSGLLKVGMKKKVVLLLRERLRRTQDLLPAEDTNTRLFDRKLAAAVKLFQSSHHLKADGIVGKETLAELNISPLERYKQIQINIERWDALAEKLGNRYILVNIPDFNLDLIEDNQKVLSMKIIVGKPTRQTPEFSSQVNRIIFNPYWDVPELIANKDIVPKVIADPYYLDKMKIKIFANQEDNARRINENKIHWQAMLDRDFPYHFRQEPGKDNALGLVKFEFPNEHDVYLHDTPAKNLFSEDVRTFSSGCIRLENPLALVDYFLKDRSDWDEERIQTTLNEGKTKYVKIPQPIPIYITYITVWVDENNHVQFRKDVYDRDGAFTQ